MNPIPPAVLGFVPCSIVVFVGPPDWAAVVAAFFAGVMVFIIIDTLLD